ncbi:kinase-like protein [Colletotrichum asianum]
MSRPNRDGLVWEHDAIWGPSPEWAREPSLEAIQKVCRRHLNIDENSRCDVSPYGKWGGKKTYHVQSNDSKAIMRVFLPLDPGYQTRGEVATMRWIKLRTSIPVPEVFAFDDTSDNEIGFEWMLMEFVPGIRAHKRWRKMPMAQKEAIAEKMADYHAQILDAGTRLKEFRTIGTLYFDEPKDNEQPPSELHFTPGRVVDYVFFCGNNYNYDIPRGPFESSQEWLKSLLNIIIVEKTAEAENAETESDKDEPEAIAEVERKLLTVLPIVFRDSEPSQQTVPWSPITDLEDILIDDDGNITGLVNWNCVSTMPSWFLTQMPLFLDGKVRNREPVREMYGNDNGDDWEDDGLDSEGKTILYWEHLMQFEQTKLRKLYTARMEKLRPGWRVEEERSGLKPSTMGLFVRVFGLQAHAAKNNKTAVDGDVAAKHSTTRSALRKPYKQPWVTVKATSHSQPLACVTMPDSHDANKTRKHIIAVTDESQGARHLPTTPGTDGQRPESANPATFPGVSYQSIDIATSEKTQIHSRSASGSSAGTSSSAGQSSTRTLKRKKGVTGLSDQYQIDGNFIQADNKQRVRSISVSQVSSISTIHTDTDSALVAFPTFRSAGRRGTKLDGLLETEGKLARYKDVEEIQADEGFNTAVLDLKDWALTGHKNVIGYETYSKQSVIQEIYEDLPKPEGENFATSPKSARNLLFGNYETGQYKMIRASDSAKAPAETKKWCFATLGSSFMRFIQTITSGAALLGVYEASTAGKIDTNTDDGETYDWAV